MNFTGRILPDRTWSDGLHEMIERKEGLSLSDRRATHARMTYQRFFRRYQRLAGMTGTGKEVAGELWRVYRLKLASIPPNRPSRRTVRPIVGHIDAAAKWQAIVATVVAHPSPRRPGSDRYAHAGRVGSRQRAVDRGSHPPCRAQCRADRARSGDHRPGRLPRCRDRGDQHGRPRYRYPPRSGDAFARRVACDRQRAARGGADRPSACRALRPTGDPGEVRILVALDDAIIEHHCPLPLRAVARLVARGIGSTGVGAIARLAQRRAERLHARMRRDLLKSDQWIGDVIAFAGDQE